MVANTAVLGHEIEQLERDFWRATMGDSERLAQLCDNEFTFVMADGISRFGRDEFVEMMTQGNYTLTSFDIDPATVIVRELAPEAVAIAYRAKSEFTLEGQLQTNDAHYSSIWMKHGDRWICTASFEAVHADASEKAGAAS